MWRSSFLGLLLALFFVSPVRSDGTTQALLPSTKAELLKVSNEVKDFLTRLQKNSDEKDSLISSLETRSQVLSESLSEAVKNSDDSEASRLRTEDLLSRARQELNELSRLYKESQFWEAVRIGAGVVGGIVVGFLVGWIL